MTKKTLLILPFIFSLFILESCTLSNRKYINGYQVSNANNKSKSTKYKAVKKRNNNLTESSNRTEKTASKKEIKVEPTLSVSTDIPFTDFSKSEKIFSSAKQVHSPPSPPSPIDPACDSIFLKNGAKIYARTVGTQKRRIIFIKCNDQTEKKYYINESEIAYIRRHDGQIFTANALKEVVEEKQPRRKIEPFSLASFIAVFGGGGVIPCFLFIIASEMVDGGGLMATALISAMIMSLIGLIIGIIGLIRAARNQEKFKGGGFAVLAIIFALLLLILIIALWKFLIW